MSTNENCSSNGDKFCDEIEIWIVKYALKHKLNAILDEVVKLHPHVNSSVFDRLSCMRLGLLALSRLALSSSIEEVKTALKFAVEIYRIWPDCVAVRHRTKVVFGLRIRIVMLAIENNLPMSELNDLLHEHFQTCFDSQEERMHATVAEVSKEGVSAFSDDVTSYIAGPTTKGRRKLLETYSIVSPTNESFRKVIETFVAKYIERLELEAEEKSIKLPVTKECNLETAQRIFQTIFGNEMLTIDSATLLRLLRAVHRHSSENASDSNADSLLQLFCTAPDH